MVPSLGDSPSTGWNRGYCVLLLALAAPACGGNGGQSALLVDVKTDFVPGVEFVSVTSELFRSVPSPAEVSSTTRQEITAVEALDFIGGQRVAEYLHRRDGEYALRVRLLMPDGRVAVERITLVRVEGRTSITVVLTRQCAGVECGSGASEAALAACLSGECVDGRCAPEQNEFCPDTECATDSDCPSSSSCAEGRCEDGVCLKLSLADACAVGQWCHPEEGCMALSETPDAGTLDAAPSAPDGGPTPDRSPTPDSGPTPDGGPAPSCDPVVRQTGILTERGADVSVAARTDGPAAVWSGGLDLFFQRFDWTGTPIGSPSRVSFSASRSTRPDLVWTGNEYGVAWLEGSTPTFLRLLADGSPIGVPVNLGSPIPGVDRVDVVWTGSEYAIAWSGRAADSVHTDLRLARVAGDGVVTPEITVSSVPGSYRDDGSGAPINPHVGLPALAWTGNTLAMAWVDRRTQISQLYFSRLNADGTPDGEPVQLTDHVGGRRRPVLEWASDHFVVAWLDGRDGSDRVYYGELGPTGLPTVEPKALSFADRDVGAPALAWNGDEAAVGWIVLGPSLTGLIRLVRLGPEGRQLGAAEDLSAAGMGGGAIALGGKSGHFAALWPDVRVTNSAELWLSHVCGCAEDEACTACLDVTCPPCQECRDGSCQAAGEGSLCGSCRTCQGGLCAEAPEGSVCAGGTCDPNGCCPSCSLRACGEPDGCGGTCDTVCCTGPACTFGEPITVSCETIPCGYTDEDPCLETAWRAECF